MSYQSAFERLRQLPGLFTLATLSHHLGVSSDVASTYVARWRRAGLVSSLGPRAGVHFNLLVDPEAEGKFLQPALRLLFPRAVIVGASALHSFGATTQIPHRLEIAVPRRPSLPTIPNVEITMRPQAWFAQMHGDLDRSGDLPKLAPHHALLDCLIHGGWQPDGDEIEWEEVNLDGLAQLAREAEVNLPESWQEEIDALLDSYSLDSEPDGYFM